MPEWDFRAADTHLANPVDGAATACTFGHAAGFPIPVFWATLDPDDPDAREEILVYVLSGAAATIVRGLGYTVGKAHRQGTIVRLGLRAGAYPEDWHVIGAGGEPAFANSWVNNAGPLEQTAFRISPDGMVHLKGLPRDGTADTTIFTLPVGYRPSETLHFPAVSGAPAAGSRIVIGTGGTVAQGNGNSTNSLTLHGVHFWAGG